MAYPNLKQSVWLVVLILVDHCGIVVAPLPPRHDSRPGSALHSLCEYPSWSLVGFVLVIVYSRSGEPIGPGPISCSSERYLGDRTCPLRFPLLDCRSQSPSWKARYIT